jgi:hypothetical protein
VAGFTLTLEHFRGALPCRHIGTPGKKDKQRVSQARLFRIKTDQGVAHCDRAAANMEQYARYHVTRSMGAGERRVASRAADAFTFGEGPDRVKEWLQHEPGKGLTGPSVRAGAGQWRGWRIAAKSDLPCDAFLVRLRAPTWSGWGLLPCWMSYRWPKLWWW